MTVKQQIVSKTWFGDEGSYGFNMVSSAKLVGTNYSNGDSFGYISNTTVQNIPADGSSLNDRVYELQREGSTLDSAQQIMEAEKPRFEFRSVSGVGKFVEEGLDIYYYLHPSGTPIIGDHGYYRLWLLQSIQNAAHSGPISAPAGRIGAAGAD